MNDIQNVAQTGEDISTSGLYKVLIAIPFYKSEELVEPVVGSLIACAADLAAIGAEVVLYNDSPDYPPLQFALEAVLPRAQATFACRLVVNDVNLGFVKTVNRAMSEAARHRQDILLLNSDTIVHHGAFLEMIRIASLDAMIGFVNPRSDNATLATLPVTRPAPDQAMDFIIEPYAVISARLPELTYVPTAVGFCMLIRWQILAEFGYLDEIYGAGYNEENDFVMRAGRCGYRAVLANRAFVQHVGEHSFGKADETKLVLELRNRAILDERYPEYKRLITEYFASPEAQAESLLGALVPDQEGRLSLAFDFSDFAARHTGTYKAGRQLVKSAVEDWGDRFNIHILCTQEVFDFHAYAELGVERCDPDGVDKFAVIFRVGQVYNWSSMRRLIQKATVIGINMLDTLSLDCTQLTSTQLYDIWQFSIAYGDFFVTPSAQSMRQTALRFHIPERVARVPSLLSLNVDDYVQTGTRFAAKEPNAGHATLLVIGNHFPHKYLVPTANAITEAFPERKIIALGQSKNQSPDRFNPYGLPPLSDADNLDGIDVGHISDEELAGFFCDADAVIFPSHYEGFGYPVLDALAARRPVFVRPLPVFKELYEGLGRDPNIHFYETTADLIMQLRALPRWQEPQTSPHLAARAARNAKDILELTEAALAKVDYHVLVDRLRALPLEPVDKAPPDPVDTEEESAKISREKIADQVASFAAQRFEWIFQRMFRSWPVYLFSRLIFRILRPGMKILRAAYKLLRSRDPT
jgi:GT2 family glycosyltransferase